MKNITKDLSMTFFLAIAALTFGLLFTSLVHAQNYSTSYTVGGTTYTSGSHNGNSYSGTSYTSGGTTYHSGSVGSTSYSGTSYTSGGTTYTNIYDSKGGSYNSNSYNSGSTTYTNSYYDD